VSEMERLRALLPHWIEHNREHANSFLAWARRASAAGEGHVAAQIEAAATRMEEANHDLECALQHMGGPADGSEHEHTH
jgi:hypothetical protein